MILAAGLGTRLRPLTDRIPKPLLEVGGETILERTARRLAAAGADRLIVNVHAFADRIEHHLERLGAALEVEVRVSRETERPLETGGGLLQAAQFFRGGEPFFLHNADILTDLDLRALYAAHRAAAPLATLAVNERPTSRLFLFDERGLCGWENVTTGAAARVREPVGAVRRIAFAGVHVIDPAIFELVTERGAFSIVDPYLRLAGAGERILPFDVSGDTWYEIGTAERLAAARAALG